MVSMRHSLILLPCDFLFTTCGNNTLQLPVLGGFALLDAECLECSNNWILSWCFERKKKINRHTCTVRSSTVKRLASWVKRVRLHPIVMAKIQHHTVTSNSKCHSITNLKVLTIYYDCCVCVFFFVPLWVKLWNGNWRKRNDCRNPNTTLIRK